MAKQEGWPGFGQRVRERLRALGYVRPDGSEDISAFTVKKGYIVTLFYKYLTHTTPSRENLLRLARDLEVSPSWLLFGDPPQMDTPPLKRKQPTKAGSRRGRDERLRQLHGQTMVRALLYPALAPAGGIGRRVA